MNGLVHKDSNSFKTYVENLQRDFKIISLVKEEVSSLYP